MIRTVLDETSLPAGIVLPHEHLVIDHRQKEGGAPPPTVKLEDLCVAMLRTAQRNGISAIVDCTPPGYGRDIPFLQRVSKRSGVAIIASTGTFCEMWSEQPRWVVELSTDQIAERFIAELGRSSSVIKVALSEHPTEREWRALDAAAIAHLRVSAPIVVHTSGSSGHSVCDRLAAHGVPLDAAVISHAGAAGEGADYVVALAQRGIWVGFDRIGHAAFPSALSLELIQQVVAAGCADRILLSHDSVQGFHGPTDIAEATFADLSYLVTHFSHDFFRAGLGTELFQQLTETNPRRWLSQNRDVF